ncbi:MAG: DUF488 family protein [Parafilimonas sp.]
MTILKTKRIYDPKEKADGFRVLVDRLWPRGLKKEDADIDVWMKDIAPSAELRQWFNHDADKWEEFKWKYNNELKQLPAVDEFITVVEKHKTVTLLYGAKDEMHNQALVIKDFISRLLKNKIAT